MQILDYTLFDTARARTIPIAVYLPEIVSAPLPLVVFNPGYRDVEDRTNRDMPPAYKNYHYLLNYFTEKGYAVISIQHDLESDRDGLEIIDPNAIQHTAREYLFRRGMENICYVLHNLPQELPALNLEHFIIAGHSNGGDIAKYFANHYPERISAVIAMDARRCRIDPDKCLRLLMFEANDTSTDHGVIPDQGTPAHPTRINLEWVVVKPRNALHISYNDAYITEDLQQFVFSTIDWFLR